MVGFLKKFGRARARKRVEEILLSKVFSNPFQPRTVIDERAIEELAQSIKEVGVLQPIVVREIEEGYEVVAGERRVRACRKLNLATIPAVVGEFSDADMVAISLLENIQRKNLSLLDEIHGFEAFYETYKPISTKELSLKLGKSEEEVARKIALAHLPSLLKKALEAGIITLAQAEKMRGLSENHELIRELKEKFLYLYPVYELKKTILEQMSLAKKNGVERKFLQELQAMIKEISDLARDEKGL